MFIYNRDENTVNIKDNSYISKKKYNCYIIIGIITYYINKIGEGF